MAQILQHPADATLVVSAEAKEIFEWEGEGENRRRGGRRRDPVTNADVSRTTGLLVSPILGVADVTALVPDAAAAACQPGAVIRLTGAQIRLSLSGADFGRVRTEVSGVSAVEPLGEIAAMIEAATEANELEDVLK